MLLTAAMVVGLMPGMGTMKVSAETTETPATADTPSITAYATAEQLKDANNFTLCTDYGNGVAQKVNFGTNGSSAQTWYIAGYEEYTKSLVMMCDPKSPLTYMPFLAQSKCDYGDDGKCYNNSCEGDRKYANNYGASDLRAYLTGDALNNFTTAEQELMVNFGYFYDAGNPADNSASIYELNDKLYAAANGEGNMFGQADIKVGSDDSITVATGDNASPNSPYVNSRYFWRRTGCTNTEYVYVDGAMGYTVSGDAPVVPAFHLNMSSVLFASGAPAGTSDASLSDAMTFRYDCTDKVTSTAVYEANGVKVTKGGDNEYLYIQWKENDTDKVYSKQITSDMNISRESLGVDSFEKCKIWIEKVEDNIAYAVEATIGHDFSAQTISDNAKKSDATCTEKAKYYYSCSVCGEVEKNDEHVFEDGELADHIDENLDGKCDTCDEAFKTFEQLGKLIIKVNQNLSDGKYANVQYTTASIDNLRKALVAANAITAESSDAAITEAFDNLLAASTVGAGGLIKADKNIVIAFADTGAVRGIAAGDGWYAIGETVTLKVTPSVGYTFSKWTTDTAGDTSSVGTESTYTFTLAEDSLYTYYAWLDEVKYTVTCNTAEGGTCSTDAADGEYVYGQTAKVTATADANYEFVGWKDSYGTTVSTDNIYSFTVIGNTTLTPEFVKVKTDEGADITYVTVSFYHQSGNLLDSQKVVSGEGKITTTVNAPTKVGFDFLGWSTKASGATAADVVDFNTAIFSEDTSLYPVFAAQSITYTLTVDGQSEQKAPQSSVTVTADPIEGKQFVGWKNVDGNIVSYDSTYTFIITGDTTLTSYYEPISAVIEKTPTINMSAPIVSVKEEEISKKATMYFNYDIPDNYTLTDIGVIYISGEVEELDVNTTGAVIRSAKSTIENTTNAAQNQFYYSKTILNNETYTFVGYITYTDASGRRITVYSNLCSTNYQGL